MEVLMVILLLALGGLLIAVGGADSRPQDIERPTHWWPATPRD
jgi:hypothetical protein